MTEIIDYAGLFPPASLDMHSAVQSWAGYQNADHAWMLGRLIIPANRLEEFEQSVIEQSLTPNPEDTAWRISALVALDSLNAQIDRIFEFNRTYAPPGSDAPPSATTESAAGGELILPGASGGIVVDAIELKVADPTDIDRAMRIIPEQLEPYFELPPDADERGFLAAIAGTGGRAKIRTGSVHAPEIPTPLRVASFIAACGASNVAFKATAGLHHPIRAEYPLTYDDAPPTGILFGFLNVFLAAAFAQQHRLVADDLVGILEETDRAAFRFDETGVQWRSLNLTTAQLARARESFATSFGSCSFEEPVTDLLSMNLLV